MFNVILTIISLQFSSKLRNTMIFNPKTSRILTISIFNEILSETKLKKANETSNKSTC